MEQNFPAGLAELKAILWALETLKPELKHRQFFLYSDHKPLTDKMMRGLNDKTFANCSTFTADLYPIWRHVPGTANVLADFLSRYHGMAQDLEEQDAAAEDRIAESSAIITNWSSNPAALDTSLPRLQYLSRLDPVIRGVMADIEDEVRHSTVRHEVMALSPRVALPVTIWKGVLLVQTENRRFLIYCPSAMRREVLVTAHKGQVSFGGHLGVQDTIANARKQMWWPDQESHCRRFVETCDICKDRSSGTPVPTTATTIPRRPHEQVEIWVEGPVARGHRKLSYILVYVDVLTKHLLLRALNGNETDEVAEAVYQITQVFGTPQRILAPRKTTVDFEVELRKRLLKASQRTEEMRSSFRLVTDNRNRPAHDRIQELLERAIQVLRESALPLPAVLMALQKEYNGSVCPESRMTPFEAKFGRTAHNPIWETYESVFRKKKANRLGIAGQYLQAQMEMRQLLRNCGQLGSPQARTQELPFQERSPVIISVPDGGEKHGFILRKTNPDQFVVYVPAGQGRQGKQEVVSREALKPAPMGHQWMAQPAWKRERAAHFRLRVQSQTDSQEEVHDTDRAEESSDLEANSEVSSDDDEVILSQRGELNGVSRTLNSIKPREHPYLQAVLDRQVEVSRPWGRVLRKDHIRRVERYLRDGGATILDMPRQKERRKITITVADAGMVARICENHTRKIHGHKISFRKIRSRLSAKTLPWQEVERLALKLQTTPEGRNQLADLVNEGLIPLTSEYSTQTTETPRPEPEGQGTGRATRNEEGSGSSNPTTLWSTNDRPPEVSDSDPQHSDVRGTKELGDPSTQPDLSHEEVNEPPSSTPEEVVPRAHEATRLHGLRKVTRKSERNSTSEASGRESRARNPRIQNKASLDRYRIYFEHHERLKRLQGLREAAKEAETFREYRPGCRRRRPPEQKQKRGYFSWIKNKWSTRSKGKVPQYRHTRGLGGGGGITGLHSVTRHPQGFGGRHRPRAPERRERTIHLRGANTYDAHRKTEAADITPTGNRRYYLIPQLRPPTL